MPCSPARTSESALRRGPSRSGSGRSEELAPSESPSSRAAAAAPPRSSLPRTAGKVTLASLARAVKLKGRLDHFLLAACAVHVFSMSSACLQTTQFFRQCKSSDNATLQTMHTDNATDNAQQNRHTPYVNTSHLDHARTRLLQRVADQRGGLGLTLSLDDRRLALTRPASTHDLLLLRTSHHELGLLRALQRHLLLLNGVVEVRSERQVGDGHIVQLDVVLLRTLLQQLRNALRHLLSLRQQLLRVVLGHHGLHDLVAQGRQHAVTEIGTHFTVDLRQVLQVGMGQHSKRNTHGLQILRTRLGGDFTRSRANIVLVGVLHVHASPPARHHDERNLEVRSLAHRLGQHSAETVEDDGSLTSID